MSYDDDEKKASGKAEVTSAEIYDPSLESIWTRLGLNLESFKRAPATTKGLVTHGDIPIELDLYDNGLLQQKMKPRHLQMIAAGGAIGTGLFVGTGGALATGGPAGIVLGWVIMGFMVVTVSNGSKYSPPRGRGGMNVEANVRSLKLLENSLFSILSMEASSLLHAAFLILL